MNQSISCLNNKTIDFPPPDHALKDPNGLLAIGGELSPERLKLAYSSGIFPWFCEDEPILWWSPDPRAVLYLDEIHISRSMKKFLRQTDYIATINHSFSDVVFQCSQNREEGTWITPSIQHAYCALHQQGLAHSVEVWQKGECIGGLYGISQGKIFCGESMFSRQENASKFALILFAQHLKHYQSIMFDCQILNPHTASLGATEISRQHYLSLLNNLKNAVIPEKTFEKQIIKNNFRL